MFGPSCTYTCFCLGHVRVRVGRFIRLSSRGLETMSQESIALPSPYFWTILLCLDCFAPSCFFFLIFHFFAPCYFLIPPALSPIPLHHIVYTFLLLLSSSFPSNIISRFSLLLLFSLLPSPTFLVSQQSSRLSFYPHLAALKCYFYHLSANIFPSLCMLCFSL